MSTEEGSATCWLMNIKTPTWPRTRLFSHSVEQPTLLGCTTSVSSAIATRVCIDSVEPTFATSSNLKMPSLMSPPSCLIRTIGQRKRSSTQQMLSSSTIQAASRNICGQTATQVIESSVTTPVMRVTKQRLLPQLRVSSPVKPGRCLAIRQCSIEQMLRVA